MELLESVTIPAQFRGPPFSANGGYACGVVARYIDGPAEITLRAPPPLDLPMTVARTDGVVTMHAGELLVAQGVEATLELDIADHVPFQDAARATKDWPSAGDHYFPQCFVCGPEPDPDGLRIHPWWVDEQRVAAPWVPLPWMCDGGVVRSEICWAALDCPGAWTWRGEVEARIVLGRLTAALFAPIQAGEEISVVSWGLGGKGRKYEAATALFDQEGVVRAASRALWITLRS